MTQSKTRAAGIKAFLRETKRKLPDTVVDTDAATLEANARDRWFASHNPDVVAFPRSTEEVSQLVSAAHKHSVPITARGAAYGYVGGCVPIHGGLVLNLGAMDKILEINKLDAVARVECGVITGKLQAEAKKRRLFYPPDPASLAHSSIGGNIATNAGGPRCLKYGVTRNYVLGLTVVLDDGTIVRTGGRTIKNKVGFDLTGLFTGSEGMLGIVTEATLRLLAIPPARAILSCSFSTLPGAAKAVQAVFSSGFTPAALEIADTFTLEAARRHLGSKLVPAGKSHILIELDGQVPSVKAESALIAELMRKCGAISVNVGVTPAECDLLWKIRRGFSQSLKASGLTKLNEDVTVPRGYLVDLMRFAAKLQQKYGFPVACFGHAGDGNIHVNIMVANHSDPKVRARAELALDELFSTVIQWGGAISGEHGIGLAKKRWWKEAVGTELDALHRRVKSALDPLGVLNPGKFLD